MRNGVRANSVVICSVYCNFYVKLMEMLGDANNTFERKYVGPYYYMREKYTQISVKHYSLVHYQV